MFSRRASAVIHFVIALSSLTLAPAVSAQESGSVISGTVKDSSGGVLPGVSVRIASESTNDVADTTTNPDGRYASEPLAPGAYRVSASLDGFETVERRVVVAARQPVTNDVTLSPARFS